MYKMVELMKAKVSNKVILIECLIIRGQSIVILNGYCKARLICTAEISKKVQYKLTLQSMRQLKI